MADKALALLVAAGIATALLPIFYTLRNYRRRRIAAAAAKDEADGSGPRKPDKKGIVDKITKLFGLDDEVEAGVDDGVESGAGVGGRAHSEHTLPKEWSVYGQSLENREFGKW